MVFNFRSSGVEVKFEPADTDTERRIIEQGLLQLRNIVIRFKEIENTLKFQLEK